MYKFLIFILIAMGIAATAEASDIPVDVRINSEYLKLASAPVVEDGTTLVPIRDISAGLAYNDIIWDDRTKCVSLYAEGKELKFTVGSDVAHINGENVHMGQKTRLIDGRAYIPVRFFSESLGMSVSWDDFYKNVELSRNNFVIPENMIDRSFTHEDIYWMSRIIYSESGGEEYLGQVAVGDVILNRVDSDVFPNTVYEVVFDRKYAVQFEPVINGTIYNTPKSTSVAAAKQSMRGESVIGECLYFFAPQKAQSSWISNNRVFYRTIGNHDFYL